MCVEAYAQKTKKLYLKLSEEECNILHWTEDKKEIVEKFKQDLTTAPVLSIPALNKPFHLFVTVSRGVGLGILTHDWGDKRKPVAYLSELLDPVSQEWPECVQAVAATALLVEESRKLTFGVLLIVVNPHQVTVLIQTARRWLTDSRILKQGRMLIERDYLTIIIGSIMNLTSFLTNRNEDTVDLEHNSLNLTNY